ncbi:MAG: alpha/beta hydrolase-fold protein [Solirubrobacteraceae bacterium]
MSITVKASRTQVWLESLGDWSWPGQGGVAVEFLPPPWVPTFPPRREPATAGPGAHALPQPGRARARRLVTGVLLVALAAVCIALAQGGQLTLAGLVGSGSAVAVEQEAPAISSASAVQSLPTLEPVSQDAAGSSIVRASYPSAALHGEGSFLVYLPPGYDSTTAHYPALYMLPGQDQSDTAFLQVGLQGQLDGLIARHAIPPVIAVMIQGGPGANLWRNHGAVRYESYILEVQELIDRTLPTVPARGARAVVGDSMGGYGAMNVALSNPYRFGVVESWLSFFNGLEGDLRTDQPIISRLGLHAFVYGGEQDHIANPDEDRPFAAALRAAGADAAGAIYPGEHNLETIEAHLGSMLVFAGRALRNGEPPAAQPRSAQPHRARTHGAS